MRNFTPGFTVEVDRFGKDSWFNILRKFEDVNLNQTWSYGINPKTNPGTFDFKSGSAREMEEKFNTSDSIVLREISSVCWQAGTVISLFPFTEI